MRDSTATNDELEALRSDAERYRWMVGHEVTLSIKHNGAFIRWNPVAGKAALDNAIDNARSV